MAEQEKDAKLSGHYRDLGREEPPRHLDDAILAAAHRDVRRKPRWLYPVAAAAAVGVLAVAVSVHVERERPEDIVAMKETTPTAPVPAQKPQESPKPAAEPSRAEARNRAERPAAAAPVFVPDPQAAPSPAPRELARRDAAGAGAERRQEDVASTTAQVPRSARAPAPASAPAAAESAAGQASGDLAARPLAKLQLDEAPMAWLQRIAKLREEGKHDEADKALAEFRKRYPDFRIPEDMLGKVVRP